MSEEEVVQVEPEKPAMTPEQARRAALRPVVLEALVDALVEPCALCREPREKLAACYDALRQGAVMARGQDDDQVGRVLHVDELMFDCPRCHNERMVLTSLGRRLAAILNVLGKDERDITGKSEPVPF